MANNKISWPPSTQLAPVPAVLLGCGNAKGYSANLITVAWCGIINSDPAMLSVSVRPVQKPPRRQFPHSPGISVPFVS